MLTPSPHGLFSEGQSEAHFPDGGGGRAQGGGPPGLAAPVGHGWQVTGHLK